MAILHSHQNIDIAHLLADLAAAFVLSALLTYGAIWLARRYSWHALPNPRSSHTAPTPQLGGIGVAFPVLAYVLIAVKADLPAEVSFRAPQFVLLFTSGLAFFVLGLYDDLRTLSPKLKLAGQVTAALPAVAIVVMIRQDGGLVFDLIAAGLGLLWVVGFVNAYNFMDGMNGKAGGFALICFIVIFAIYPFARGAHQEPGLISSSTMLEGMQVMPLSVVAAGSTCGFLLFNCRAKALIFLGDSGSHFLGYFLAAVTFLASTSLIGEWRSLLAFTVLFMPFVYDVALTLVRRAVAGKKLWEAHREHLYQRLMIAGMSHMRVLRICVLTYVACGVFALMCARADTVAVRFACLGGALAVMAAYTAYVHVVERRVGAEPVS